MGACGTKQKKTNEKTKRYSVKIQTIKMKKNKDKNYIGKTNFEIIDTITKKTIPKLINNNYTLSELLSSANYNTSGDLDIQLKNGAKINSELNTDLKDILDTYYPGQILLTVTILVTTKGLSIPDNIKKAYQDMSPIIGNAIFENPKKFGISLYYRETESLEIFYFNKEMNKELIKFGSFSSFCSAKGFFYISGGENEEISDTNDSTEEYSDFVCIDMNKLNYYNIYLNVLPNLTIKRTWHSMIFVPNQYIFIVGGLNTKAVEIYDINNNKIYIDSELKEKRCEPTMCLVNNTYLYAFCGFSPFKNFNHTIERCNLIKKKREWEFIEYSSKINPSFFGVSYFKDDEILLISSKDNFDDEHKNYTVKIENDEDVPDEIQEKILNYNEVRTFKDKLFYPLFDNIAINSPMIIGEKKQILLMDINNGNIEIKNYK